MKPGLLERLLMKLIPYTEIVKTVDGEQVVYLRRFFLKRWGKKHIYLHHILRSDDDPDPHDHPWDFTSVVLRGGYIDQTWDFFPRSFEAKQIRGHLGMVLFPDNAYPGLFRAGGARVFDRLQRAPPGSIIRRRAEHIHRVILNRGPAWTLVFCGPRRRTWGFVEEDRWTFWRSYLNVWGKYEAD